MKLLKDVAQELNIPVNFRTNGINHPADYLFTRIPKLFGIRIYPVGEGLSCYVVEKLSKKLYLAATENEILRETFGIVFSSDGIKARPLPMFSVIPTDYIHLETRLDVDGQNICGLLSNNHEPIFITRSGIRVTKAPKGAEMLVRECSPLGLTPQFTMVPDTELSGAIVEVPGWHLVGIRSIYTGRILPLRHLAQIAGGFDLQPILLFKQDRAGFINNSHHKGLIDFFVTQAGEQFISRELTDYYKNILPVINFLRYGRDITGYVNSISTNESHCCLLTTDERRLYERTREILSEMRTDTQEALKTRMKKARKTIMKR